jgi:hypothetical protein
MVAAADFRHDDRTPTPLCLSVCPHLQPKVGTAFRCWRQTLNPNAHPLWKTQKADNDTHKSAEWSPQRKGGRRENGNSLVSVRGESLCLSRVCVSFSSGCRQIDNVQTFGICADGAAAGFCSFFLPFFLAVLPLQEDKTKTHPDPVTTATSVARGILNPTHNHL